MAAQLIKQEGHELTIQLTVNISGSMLDAEENIQQAVNEVGCLATQQALKQWVLPLNNVHLANYNTKLINLFPKLYPPS